MAKMFFGGVWTMFILSMVFLGIAKENINITIPFTILLVITVFFIGIVVGSTTEKEK